MVAGNPVVFSPTASANRQPLEVRLRQGRSARLEALLRSPLRLDIGGPAATATALLDRVHDGLSDGSVDAARAAMLDLFGGLHTLRRETDPLDWKDIVKRCVDHPVAELVHHDPFTRRSFGKPRGYAGDAVLIDYIYTNDPASDGTTSAEALSPVGRAIFDFTTAAPASAGVRTRRDLMAAVIDHTCAVVERPDILSVACGHLREASVCHSVRRGLAGRIVGLDQDELSLDVVDRDLGDHGVVTHCASIKALFRGELAGERFDLIYSTGLYDYLEPKIASRLTARLFAMLRPGGRLVLANFLPDLYCAGFMETFMGWDLIYRTPTEVDGLLDAVPFDQIAHRRTYVERNANIAFLDVTRR